MISPEKHYEMPGAYGTGGRALNVSSTTLFGVPDQCEVTFLGPLLIVFSKGGRGALNVTWMCWGTWARWIYCIFLEPLPILCKQDVLEGAH